MRPPIERPPIARLPAPPAMPAATWVITARQVSSSTGWRSGPPPRPLARRRSMYGNSKRTTRTPACASPAASSSMAGASIACPAPCARTKV